MRICCPICDERAVITQSNKIHAHYRELYCDCRSCGARFKASLALVDIQKKPSSYAQSTPVSETFW